jgi:hypothetical protein
MSAFRAEFIATRSMDFIGMIKECDESGFPKVGSRLGLQWENRLARESGVDGSPATRRQARVLSPKNVVEDELEVGLLTPCLPRLRPWPAKPIP